MQPKILRNAIRTPDGTVLESKSRWDYKWHEDKITGKTYMVVGGYDYLRRSVHADQVDLSLTLADPHEVLREELEWGTYGKDGSQPLRYVKIKDMSSEHINNILDTIGQATVYFDVFRNELRFRGEL